MARVPNARIVVVSIGVLLLGITSFASLAGAETGRAESNLVVEFSSLFSQCNACCHDCGEKIKNYSCNPDVASNDMPTTGGMCRPIATNCDDYYNDECGPPFVALPPEAEDSRYWLALETASIEDLRQLMAVNPGIVYFNEERKSLQVLGCQGRVIANVPLAAHPQMELLIAD